MLYTNLKHIETASEHRKIITENSLVVIVCGRMNAHSINAFELAEKMKKRYKHVLFFDMEYENPESKVLKEEYSFQNNENLPFAICYKNGNKVQVVFDFNSPEKFENLLHEIYGIYQKVKH
jgi:thioredoxin 1